MINLFEPVCCQTLPESDAAISTPGQDPGVWHSFGFGAHTHIGIQTEAQQEAAQKSGVVLTVSLLHRNSSGLAVRPEEVSFISKAYFTDITKCYN